MKGQIKSFRFDIPMIWREQANHSDDCYFCSVDVNRFNKRNKKVLVYPNLKSAIRPLLHSSELPVPHPPNTLNKFIQSDEEEDAENSQKDFGSIVLSGDSPQCFSQKELNDLVRDLCLKKDGAELLGSRLKEKKV